MTRHRGPHPADAELFSADSIPALRTATGELSWLLARGYKLAGAIALVGNRHSLRARQRLAVQRAACSDGDRDARAARRQSDLSSASARTVLIDGFNCVIALEAALSGGVLLVGRDGVLRDMASVHGSYRRVAETEAAVELIVSSLSSAEVASARFYLDRPVSNSARLAGWIREASAGRLTAEVELVNNPDQRLVCDGAGALVCSGDGIILDRCGDWLDLPAAVLELHAIDHWRVDLRA